MASDTGSSSRLIVRAATAALLSFAPLLPANAQFWGNSWGGRQQQPQQPYNPYAQQRYNPYAQQPYNPYGGQWGYGGYPQRQRSSFPRQRERPREVEKEQSPDFSHAPSATPRGDATVKIVVMGDANADWLAYGLEDAFSENSEIGIVRKHRTDSGLIWYDRRRESEWPQVAREIIAAEKPNFIVMMIGNNDHQTIREKAPPPAPASAQPIQPPPAIPPPRPDLERQPVEQQQPQLTPTQVRKAAYGPWEFQSEKWELAYIKRIDATIAALKSAGVPIIWVGLPSQRGTDATNDSSYLNEFYRSQAEKAGIVYVDIWDGFVDEAGNFSSQGPDYLGQTRRLRTSDGVYFTKFGARKLALYVEREIERVIRKGMAVALPAPVGPAPQAPNAKTDGPAQRPAAGPIVPLTETRVVQEELMGGPSTTPAAATGATVTRALTKGETLAAPSGRADDFRWPRDVVNAEPAAAELTTPDTAASDADATSAKLTQRKSAMDAYAAQTGRRQKPAQRRPRPRLTHDAWSHQPPNFPSFRSSGW